MGDADGNTLNGQFAVHGNICVFILIGISGLLVIPLSAFVIPDDFESASTVQQGNDNISDLRLLVLVHHNVIPGVYSCVDHGFTLCDESKEVPVADNGFGHTDIFDDLFFFLLTFTAGNVTEDRHGGMGTFHPHPFRRYRFTAVVGEFSAL